jgi:tryptophanyl-tRNA synthetase
MGKRAYPYRFLDLFFQSRGKELQDLSIALVIISINMSNAEIIFMFKSHLYFLFYQL